MICAQSIRGLECVAVLLSKLLSPRSVGQSRASATGRAVGT